MGTVDVVSYMYMQVVCPLLYMYYSRCIHMYFFCLLVTVAACLACGHFMSSFPAECQPRLPELLPLFTGSLEDSMASVRKGAATSLATLVRVYGEMTHRWQLLYSLSLSLLETDNSVLMNEVS